MEILLQKTLHKNLSFLFLHSLLNVSANRHLVSFGFRVCRDDTCN